MVYLDNAATTRVCPEAAEAAVHMMTECFGNPSTTYKLGREAKAAVDKARGQIAGALGCRPDEVYFTSWRLRGRQLGAHLRRAVDAPARQAHHQLRRGARRGA